MSFRRMIPFLLLNVLVSATVVMVILWWWDGRSPQALINSPGIQDESALAALLPPQPDTAPQPTEQPSAEEAVAAVEGETAVETAGNPSGEQIHVVRAGDTVGRISNQYGVTMEAIMEANGMSNPNFLSIGQELIIPNLSGIPTPIPTLNEAEEAQAANNDAPPTPIPTVSASEGVAQVEITAVRNAGNVDREVIEIVNNGSSEVNLAGWQVRDQSGNSYTFGYITLYGEGAGILLFSGSGLDGTTNFNWGQAEAVWEPGETVQLFDTDDNVITEFIVP